MFQDLRATGVEKGFSHLALGTRPQSRLGQITGIRGFRGWRGTSVRNEPGPCFPMALESGEAQEERVGLTALQTVSKLFGLKC